MLLLCLTVVFFLEITSGAKILITTNFLFYRFLPWIYYKPPDVNITKLSYHLDVILEFYPLLEQVFKQIKSLQIPLWNPYICSGLPFVAEPQIGVFYPLNVIIFYFLPPVFAFGYCAIIHVFLMGVFAYIFLMSLSISRMGSLTGALILMFNGTTVCSLFPDMITVLCWLPLILYLYEKSLQKKERLYAYLGGLTMGAAFLTGELRIAAYIAIFLLLYSIFRIFFCEISKEKKNLSFALFNAALIYFIGILTGGVLLLPLFELLPFSSRLHMIEQAPNLYLNAKEVLTAFVFPDTINESEFSIMLYVGIPAVFLCLISFLKKNKNSLFFLSSAVIFYLSSSKFIVDNLFSRVFPLFKMARFEQELMLPMISFCAANLAAIGFDTLFGGGLFKKAKILSSPRFNYLLRILTIVLILAGFFGVGRNKLAAFLGNARHCYFRTEATDFLGRDKEPYRIMRMTSRIDHYHDDILPSNTQMVYGIYDAQGYASFLLQRYGEFMDIIEPGIYVNEPGENFISGLCYFKSLDSRLIDLANIKYILSERRIENEGFYLVYDKEFKIYQNKNVLPRAFFVPKARLIKDAKELLNFMQGKGFDPAKEVILEDEFSLRQENENLILPDTQVHIEKYEPGLVLVDISANQNGWLVLSDSHYPGWKAFVDNKVTQIYKADYIFRAVAVDKGKHRVMFVYSPVSFKIGLTITICTIIIVLVLVIKSLCAANF